MKKLFVRVLALYIALLPLVPSVAEAASRFGFCSGTCTWDNTSTAMWCATNTGCSGASAHVAGDDVTLSSTACVGGTTCTITTFNGTISAASIDWSACTASTTGCIVKADTNNTNFTLSSGSAVTFNGSGTGTRKWLAGTGTYNLTSTSGFNGCFNMQTTTNDQGSVFSGATWTCSGAAAGGNARIWHGGGFSFGPTTWNGNSSRGGFLVTGANTYASLVLGGPNYIILGGNQTVTGALTSSGTSSSNPLEISANTTEGTATISMGAASTADWLAVRGITFSGAGALTATNCLNLGLNTLGSSTCAVPSGGGGGPPRFVGG